VAPLFLFLLASFIAPIASLLWRGVADSDIARILPRTTAALASWTDSELRPIRPSRRSSRTCAWPFRDGTLASAATRLNYDVNGFRTLMFGTARRLGAPNAGAPLEGGARAGLIALDAKWGERETWAAIRRAGGPLTDLYLLAHSTSAATPTTASSRRRRSRRSSSRCSSAPCGCRRW
jgi:putative spermidine/putrescine transport system permease protein